jgi:hypothetical protein
MRLVPERYDEDTVFAYASKVVHDEAAGQWTLYADPQDCLVGDPVGIPIDAVRAEQPSRTEIGGKTIYEGRILFSAGVIMIVNGQHVLIYRDEDAPTDQDRWTSPAGRGDHDPGTTALKEFYEELAVTEGGKPAFITVDERSAAFEDTYEATLRTVDQYAPPGEWRRVAGTTPERYRPYLSSVVTEFGDERCTDELLAYYDVTSNTLELRFVVNVDVTPERAEAFAFHDGEAGREVKWFTESELLDFDSDDLVPTDAYVARELLPEPRD